MQALVTAADAGDAETAWDLLSEPSQRREGPFEEFEQTTFPELRRTLAPFAKAPLPVEVSENIDGEFGLVALSRGGSAYAVPMRLEGRRLARRASRAGEDRGPRAAARLAGQVRRPDRRGEARPRRRRRGRALSRRRDARPTNRILPRRRDDLRELRQPAEAGLAHGRGVHERSRRSGARAWTFFP